MKIKKDFAASQSVTKSLQAFYEKPILRVSFELVMSILVVAVFALFALRPTLITMSNLLKEIEEKQQLDEDLQEKIAALSTAQSEWTAYKSQFDKLERSFFQDPSLEEVMLYLEYLARQEDVLVTTVTSPEIPVKMEPSDDQSIKLLTLTPYETNFQAVGSYENILNFLGRIEQQQPLMSVESVQIAINQKDDVSPLSVSFQLRLYVQEEPKAQSESDTPAKAGAKAAAEEI
jgi:Tfp pilus assembly protein PilO